MKAKVLVAALSSAILIIAGCSSTRHKSFSPAVTTVDALFAEKADVACRAEFGPDAFLSLLIGKTVKLKGFDAIGYPKTPLLACNYNGTALTAPLTFYIGVGLGAAPTTPRIQTVGKVTTMLLRRAPGNAAGDNGAPVNPAITALLKAVATAVTPTS